MLGEVQQNIETVFVGAMLVSVGLGKKYLIFLISRVQGGPAFIWIGATARLYQPM